MQLEGKTAAVIGLARAGTPAAKFLAARGAHVIGYDSKPHENLSAAVLELETFGVQLQSGEHHFAGIETCDIVVLSPGLKVHFEPLQSLIAEAEARGAEVIGELELAARFCPCPMIAVTGTKGKSTTVKLITELLRACGVDAYSAGNIGTPLIEMLPSLSADSWAVVEVSSFQLEKAPTFRPKIAVLLSLLEDHQDYHPTLEQYWDTKLKIFANQGEGDVAILNVDDPRVMAYWLESLGSVGLLSLGISGGATQKTSGRDSLFDMSFEDGDVVSYTPDTAPKKPRKPGHIIIGVDEVPLKGQHNLSNICAALEAVVNVLGKTEFIDKIGVIADALRNFQNLPHRLEIVARKNGVTWVNDSQSTIPDASIAALKAFPAPVTLLLGGRAKIEASAYENLMRAVREAKARVYLFGEAAPMLREVALSIGVEKSHIFEENLLAEVVRMVKMNESDGETVILSPACASFDQFQSYEQRGETFRSLVRALPD